MRWRSEAWACGGGETSNGWRTVRRLTGPLLLAKRWLDCGWDLGEGLTGDCSPDGSDSFMVSNGKTVL
jgi:hypothetical protein